MDPTGKKKFGRTDLEVTAMGFGTAPIGNQFRFVAEEDARAVIAGAWDAGLRYFDTAPMYGHGLAEHRLGEGLRWRPRDEYVLSTKVGRLLKPVPRKSVTSAFWVDPPPFEIVHDYSYDAVDALLRGQPPAARPRALRHPLHPRHRQFQPSAGSAEGAFPHRHGQRLQGARQAPLRRAGLGDRRRL